MRQRYTDQEWAQERRRSAWALVWMIAIPLGFTGAAVWWLESRFGSGVALMILGGLVGVIEVDTQCTKASARDFVEVWLAPRAMKPYLTWHFRTFIAGQGVCADEMRGYFASAGFPFNDIEIEQPEGLPVVAARAIKAE